MKSLKNSKITKIGVISQSLLALAGCSTQEVVRYQVVKPLPLLCPQSHQCQMPHYQIKNNGDLVTTLDRALTTIELCQVEITALKECISQGNENE